MANSPGSFLEESSWFHGNITREQAQTVLQTEGTEGSFLVREISGSPGEYALSVLSSGEVYHIQITRHEGDAFFSIREDGPIIHGLDELIKHYQTPSLILEDDILLSNPVLNTPPPPDCRRHGRTNLLHRATKEGSVPIVSDMVRCGHRSLDAKNEEGQTAAHLAASAGHNGILSLLIKAGTSVNAKDSRSLTPLHYAAIHNLPETARLLLEEGGANPQVRRNDNGWVAMHEAASRGHLEVCRTLWRAGAPLRPRTLEGQLPVHLALEQNHEETTRFFDTIQSKAPGTSKSLWYHGRLSRQDALEALQSCQKKRPDLDPNTSFFLVRRHSQKESVYVLTLLFQGHTYRFEIAREGNFFYIDDGPYLDSLEHVVDHYSRFSDGLPCALNIPVEPKLVLSTPPPRLPTTLPPPLPRRTPGMSPSERALPLPPFCRERIPHELLTLGESLGGGEYGEVFQGTLIMGQGQPPTQVAVKTLKGKDLNSRALTDFLKEAKVMMELEHENIVRLIGVTGEPEVYVVQELLTLGSLETYLKEWPGKIVPDRDFRNWGHQVAKGMVYLMRKRFVHRDLAARNILLSKDRMAKISDFGLSRALGGDSDYYTSTQGGRWPVRWYAPESLTYGTFSHASDVWSYGVTLWEIYSFGETPYGEENTGRQVIEIVERGERLEKPKHCPEKIYSVMKKCWTKEPELRPTFTFLENFFASAEVQESQSQQNTPISGSTPTLNINSHNLNLNVPSISISDSDNDTSHDSLVGAVQDVSISEDQDANANPCDQAEADAGESGSGPLYCNTLERNSRRRNDNNFTNEHKEDSLIQWD